MLFEEVFNLLLKSYEFIYEIKEKYYYIGATVFRECTDEEIRNFRNLCEEWTKIEKMPYPITRKEAEPLIACFATIFPGDEELTTEKMKTAKNELGTFLSSISDNELQAILLQRERFIALLDLKDGNINKYNRRKEYV